MTAKANVREGVCRHECSRTFHGEHGGALPGGPFPGTSGSPGDVRRCDHGRLWVYADSRENGFYCLIDVWRPISRWWEPVLYRRARRLLDAEAD